MARISVNKLANFLITPNPVARRRIVRDQKYPSDFIVAKYRQAYAPIRAYLSGNRDESLIKSAIANLRITPAETSWGTDDNLNTASALEAFLELADKIPSSHNEVYQGGMEHPPKLNIAGVDISVRPDILIEFDRRGIKHLGAIKLHFVKSSDAALTKNGAEYVATLLHKWLEVNGPDGSKPSLKHCLSIDVFRGTVVCAPNATTRRMSEITAACEDIALRWTHL